MTTDKTMLPKTTSQAIDRDDGDAHTCKGGRQIESYVVFTNRREQFATSGGAWPPIR